MPGPVPAKLVLLRDLTEVDEGCKVRFLGCVTSLEGGEFGSVAVQHPVGRASLGIDSPNAATETNDTQGPMQALPSVTALLDLSHIETRTATGLDAVTVGSWLNVIGYVVRRGSAAGSTTVSVVIQALMVWEAHEIDPKAYERAVLARRDASDSLDLIIKGFR